MSNEHTDASVDRQIGPHRVTIELPDVLCLRLNGDVELDHVKDFYALINELPADVYVLRDDRKSRMSSPQAREFMVKNIPAGKMVALISFGASFQRRTMIRMIAKAVRLLRHATPILEFTSTEAEARAWIDKIRADARP
jgi:hypothetical protein